MLNYLTMTLLEFNTLVHLKCLLFLGQSATVITHFWTSLHVSNDCESVMVCDS